MYTGKTHTIYIRNTYTRCVNAYQVLMQMLKNCGRSLLQILFDMYPGLSLVGDLGEVVSLFVVQTEVIFLYIQ